MVMDQFSATEIFNTSIQDGACTFRPFDFHPMMKIEIQNQFPCTWIDSI